MRPAPETTYRNFTSDDIESVVDIESGAFPKGWELPAFERYLADPRALCRLAIGSAGIVAFAISLIEGTTLHICNLAVRKDLRKRGLGIGLLGDVLLQARQLGLTRAVLEVQSTNLSAISLYRRGGFRVERLLPGYYEGHDGFSMARDVR